MRRRYNYLSFLRDSDNIIYRLKKSNKLVLFCLSRQPAVQTRSVMSGLGALLSYPNVLDVATYGVSSLLIYSGVVGAYVDPLGCKYLN